MKRSVCLICDQKERTMNEKRLKEIDNWAWWSLKDEKPEMYKDVKDLIAAVRERDNVLEAGKTLYSLLCDYAQGDSPDEVEVIAAIRVYRAARKLLESEGTHES